MDTPLLQATAANAADGDLEEGLRVMAEMSPNGRIARPEEVADVAVWLLLDAPAHMSGALLPVDAAETAI
jgi:NAD(P)-dependent dehydrogenase (short-subunit alcohol dehydrogenase family)